MFIVKRFLSLFLLMCIVPANMNCQQFIKDTVRIDEKLLDGTLVSIKMQRGKITHNFPYENPFMWGGDIDAVPKTVIVEMEIKCGGERIYIPFSAYSDLGDPRNVSFEKTNNNYSVIVTGGDAGGSYKAILFFENGNIKERKVMHGEFPDEVWEKTEYSFQNDDGKL